MRMDKNISAEKLLKWLEESEEAKGFWGSGEKSVEAFDNLTDAINNGDLDATK